MIQRVFHPIGQGAFYSERHDGFNIVYDCGNWRDTKLADKVVKGSFNSGDEIDILFISHFDNDHVNKIKILKDNFNIKKVVLPLLHKNEKMLLINLYVSLGYSDTVSLIQDPMRYFGNDTIVLTVEISENHNEGNERATINDEEVTINIEDIDSSRTIKSGTKLKLGMKDWVFIPYNFEYNNRAIELKNAFKKRSLDIDKIRKDVNYSINNRKDIKQAYDDVTGRINQNSMILYSGPIEKKGRYYISNYPCIMFCAKHYRAYKTFYNCCTKRAACIYTGDADLNITNVREVYKRFWYNVGTIQIPHHGDLKSFNINIIESGYYYCPISVGNNNTYGHPAVQVILDIYKEDCLPILITECLDSMYVQEIY